MNSTETTREPVVHTRPVYRSRGDAHGLTLAIALPGVDRDGLNVTFHADERRLVLDAKRPARHAADTRPVRGDTRARHYRLALRVADKLDGERIEATLNDGVLELRIPLRAEARPRQIAVA